jgi:hypothetical protein
MRALTLLISLLLVAPAGQASQTPTHRAELLAWSTDGLTALVRETTTTPSGGGERALRLLSRSGAKRVVVSHIDAPQSKRPQKVSDKSCVQRLRSFGKLLERRGFPDVAVAATCEDRANLVSIGQAESARTADTWFSGDGTHLTRAELALGLDANVLELSADGQSVGKWAQTPQPLKMRASLSPAHTLLVVIHDWWPGNSGVLKVLSSKTGLPQDFKPVRP